MLDSPESLLGRLQRGRGDAVRELLAMPRDAAHPIVLQCLCTEADLIQHHEAFVELVLRLSPDLSPWYRWIEALGEDAAEDTRLHAFNLLRLLACQGHASARAFLNRYVLKGRHWQEALSQLVCEIPLDETTWRALLPRVDDEMLTMHIRHSLGADVWQALATGCERVARLLDEERARRAKLADETSWSAANYANAKLSQRRWRVLQSLVERDPGAAVPYLIDGLWDGSEFYRQKCMMHCDLEWPGVRERLAELACLDELESGAAAKAWLEKRS